MPDLRKSHAKFRPCTGKSLSEALIFAPTIWQQIVHGNSMNNLLSYCGLVDARITASEKDLPVSWVKNQQNLISKVIFLCQRSVLSF